MKNKKKFKRFSIIFLIILCILLVILIFFLTKTKKETLVDGLHTQEDLEIMDDEIDSYLSDKIVPVGMSTLYGKYKGNNDLNDIYRSLYRFINYLPTLSKKVQSKDESGIESFYESNKAKIEENTGINNSEDFKKFISYLNSIGYSAEKYKNCEIDTSTFNNSNNYFSFNISFNFEGFENKMKLKLNFANGQSSNKVFYSTIEENNN